ncbi:type II toxin-antitoxin system Phd/YefM family antitoxin [Crenothrix sp.]|uniref:type II toxin-antitoxin system Phd/YefM family antitoxin n=1 Tax=Crenothrix sp. TaxID=3100433 RepID=UPI00374C993D
MKTTSIAYAKNNLSSLIQQVEASEPIHLTRHGKAVAVVISETDYQNLTPKSHNLFKAITDWRDHLPNSNEEIIGDAEIQQWRETSQGRSFTWED